MKTLSEYLPGLRLAMMLIAVLALPAANAVSDDTPMTIDADRQYGYAQSRLDDDAFDEAVVAFNRFIYFFPEDPRVARARFQVGTAHFAARRYQEAAAVFERLTADYAGLPLENEAFFMLSRCRARQGLNAQAMLDLHNLLAVTTDANVADEARHALGWLQVDQGRWDQAFREFDHISSVNRSRYRVDRLQQVLEGSDAIPTKNPALAGAFSVVPGGGQLYCGRYRDALTAFVVNAGLIWAAWEAFDEDLYALGGVITFVELGFYAGNITGAVSSAHKYNRARADEFRERLYREKLPSISLAPFPGGAALYLSVNF